VTDGVIEPTGKKRKTNGVSPREYARLRTVAFGSQSVKDVVKTDDAPAHDPWDDDDAAMVPEDPRFDYLEKKKPIRAPTTLKEAPISLLAGAKDVPAVAKPKPGTSYNPVFEDWDALLTTEGAKEVEAEKKRLHNARLEEGKAARIVAATREAERDEGLLTEDESAWEGFESEFEEEWLIKKRPERKTPTQRRKVERRKERERAEQWQKKEKQRVEMEKRIGVLKKQIDKEARESAVVAEAGVEGENKAETDEIVLRRRRLGKDVYIYHRYSCVPCFANTNLQSPGTSARVGPPRRAARFITATQARGKSAQRAVSTCAAQWEDGDTEGHPTAKEEEEDVY